MWERGWEGKHRQVWAISKDGLGVRIMSPSAFENKLGKAVSTERDLSFYCTRWNSKHAVSTERDLSFYCTYKVELKAGGINRKGQQHLLLL